MPLFNTHAPTHSSTFRANINAQKMIDYKRPIGVIGSTSKASYGFDGDKYYVEIGCVSTLAFGRMNMTFEQAKCAFDAISLFDIDVMKWDFDMAKKTLKESRKNSLTGDKLMFFYGDVFKIFDCSL